MRTADLIESVTNRIVSGFEDGIIPWQNPLKKGYPILPSNMVTGKPYTDAKALLLSMNDYHIPYYATFNQIAKMVG